MWLTPSSSARRSTAIDRDRSLGSPFSNGILPVRRIAPNPSRLTVRSPSRHVPAADAGIAVEVTAPGYPGLEVVPVRRAVLGVPVVVRLRIFAPAGIGVLAALLRQHRLRLAGRLRAAFRLSIHDFSLPAPQLYGGLIAASGAITPETSIRHEDHLRSG